MSDDPETRRQIAELSLDERPLLVLDVDDVLLEFMTPLPLFLAAQGYELRLDSFRLNGNVYDTATGLAAEQERVRALIDDFFHAQAEWQSVKSGAAEALAHFGDAVEIVLLTAMSHRHRATRRRHLDALGLTQPLLTTEMAKGPAILALRGANRRPVAFVDDMPHNLASAMQSVPDASLFHMMSDERLRAVLPPLPEGVHAVADWEEATPRIARALGL